MLLSGPEKETFSAVAMSGSYELTVLSDINTCRLEKELRATEDFRFIDAIMERR